MPGEMILKFVRCKARVDRRDVSFVRRATLLVTNQRCGVVTEKFGRHDVVELPLELTIAVEFDRRWIRPQIIVVGGGIIMRLQCTPVNGTEEFVKVLREQFSRPRYRSDGPRFTK